MYTIQSVSWTNCTAARILKVTGILYILLLLSTLAIINSVHQSEPSLHLHNSNRMEMRIFNTRKYFESEKTWLIICPH